MEKVARRYENNCVEHHDNGSGQGTAAVRVEGVPPGTRKGAIKDLLLTFGAISSIKTLESNFGGNAFVVVFKHRECAELAVKAGKGTLNTAVIVSPLPHGSNLASLRRICARWGPVASAAPHGCNDDRSAIIVFETRTAADKAIGEHTIEASTELRVTGIPMDAKEDHIRSALGGVRGGVMNITFEPVHGDSSRSAIVAFTSSQLAARAVGMREMSITGRGGAISALAKAQASAYKGHAAPWHSTLKGRPFANYEMHSYQFGHQPCSTREFKQRAAGTYGIENRNKDLAGSSMRYTTKRVRVKAEVRRTILHVRACTSVVTIKHSP